MTPASATLRINTTGGNPIEIFHAMGAAKSRAKTVDQHFDRVTTSYQLNESMMKSRSRRALKNTVNSFLNLSRLGDSLKVFCGKTVIDLKTRSGGQR